MADNGELFDVNFGSGGDDTINLDATGEVYTSDTGENKTKPAETVVVEDTSTAEDKLKLEAEAKAASLIDIITDADDGEGAGSTTNEEDSKKAPTNEEDSSPITPFASLLQEKGFLPHLNMEEFSKAEDPMKALEDAFQKEQEQYRKAIVNDFPEELRELAEAVSNGVSMDSLLEPKVRELSYSQIKPSEITGNEDLQKRLIKDALLSKGVRENKIDKLITLAEENAELETEATEALGELKDAAKAEQDYIARQHAADQKAMEEKNKSVLSKIQSTVNGSNEIIPGIEINQNVKDTLYNTMTGIVKKDQRGNPLNGIMAARAEDPVKFDMTVAYLMNMTNNFTSWDEFNTQAKTSASENFLNTLSKTKPIAGKAKKKPAASAVDDDIDWTSVELN